MLFRKVNKVCMISVNVIVRNENIQSLMMCCDASNELIICFCKLHNGDRNEFVNHFTPK